MNAQTAAAKTSNITKEEKRRLKRELKARRRTKKLITSIRHSIVRKDETYEIRAREELNEYLKVLEREGAHDIVQEAQIAITASHQHYQLNKATVCDSHDLEAKTFIMSVRDNLMKQKHERKAERKLIENEHACNLLRHMTKGTQELNMFEDKSALWGYTKQKFLDRAMLIYSSLTKLNEYANDGEEISGIGCGTSTRCSRRNQSVYNLFNGDVKRACSIGCGPGNDLVGLAAFLKIHFQVKLEEAYFMDWAITNWETILDPLRVLLQKNCSVYETQTSSCDVTQTFCDSSNSAIRKYCAISDFISISYLLTETRGRWEKFVLEMFNVASDNTIFYFAEPIPWQLFRLMSLWNKQKDSCNFVLNFIWLDSSMHHDHLQYMDGREGPAVLLAVKSRKSGPDPPGPDGISAVT